MVLPWKSRVGVVDARRAMVVGSVEVFACSSVMGAMQ